MLNKLHIIISIAASIITIILGIYLRLSSNEIIISVISVIIVCYFIGLIAKIYLTKNVFTKGENKTDNTSNENKLDKIEDTNNEIPIIQEGNDDL